MDKTARTENKWIVYSKSSPNEKIETGEQREQHEDEQCTVGLEKGPPCWYCVSRFFLEGCNNSASATNQCEPKGASYKGRLHA